MKTFLAIKFQLINPCEWPAYYFSQQYHPCIKHLYYQSRGNDHQLRKFLVVKQFLLSSTLKRTVLRICILMFGCKRLQVMSNSSKKCPWHLTIWTVCPYPCYKIKLTMKLWVAHSEEVVMNDIYWVINTFSLTL